MDTAIFKYAGYAGEFHPLREITGNTSDLVRVECIRSEDSDFLLPQGYETFIGEYPAIIPCKNTTVYLLSEHSIGVNPADAIILSEVPHSEKLYYHKETFLPSKFPVGSARLIAKCFSGAPWLSYSYQGIISPRGFKPQIPRIELDLALSNVTSYNTPSDIPSDGIMVVGNSDPEIRLHWFRENGVDLSELEYCKFQNSKSDAVVYQFTFTATHTKFDPAFAKLRQLLADTQAQSLTVRVREPNASRFPPQDFSVLDTSKPIAELTVTPNLQHVLLTTGKEPLRKDVIFGSECARASRVRNSGILPLWHTPYGALIPRCFPQCKDILRSPFTGRYYITRTNAKKYTPRRQLEEELSILPMDFFRDEKYCAAETKLRELARCINEADRDNIGLAIVHKNASLPPDIRGDKAMSNLIIWWYDILHSFGLCDWDTWPKYLHGLTECKGVLEYSSPNQRIKSYAYYLPTGSINMNLLLGNLPPYVYNTLKRIFSVSAIEHFSRQHLLEV